MCLYCTQLHTLFKDIIKVLMHFLFAQVSQRDYVSIVSRQEEILILRKCQILFWLANDPLLRYVWV